VCEAAVLKQQRARLHQAWRISAAGADRHLENERGFARQQFEIRIHAASSIINQQQPRPDPLSPI
jgi:hypothetical protein